MAEELGHACAQSSLQTSGMNTKNATRQYSRVVRKFNCSLNVPVSSYHHIENGSAVTMPFVKPADVMCMLFRKFPWLLLGGCEESDASELLLSFWDRYQVEHPTHAVFQHSRCRLACTFPVTVHGDGGRTQKKQPLEIFSFQPAIGIDTALSEKKSVCTCCSPTTFGGADLTNPLVQCVNLKHLSYLTHFLCFAYPSKKYFEFPSLLTGLLEAVLDNLANACEDGIRSSSGQIWYPACIGFKLDMEWMKKVGSLTRSYMNVGHKSEKAVCHECDAGLPHVYFEDINPNARWVQTCYKTLPWESEPPWHNVPFDDTKKAMFLRRDCFHVFRLGICRNFLASCIILLCYMGCYFTLFNNVAVVC